MGEFGKHQENFAIINKRFKYKKNNEKSIKELPTERANGFNPFPLLSAGLWYEGHKVAAEIMSDNIAEQNEELEVLASIFPEEFKMLEGDRSFKILLKPNPDGGDNHGTFLPTSLLALPVSDLCFMFSFIQ